MSRRQHTKLRTICQRDGGTWSEPQLQGIGGVAIAVYALMRYTVFFLCGVMGCFALRATVGSVMSGGSASSRHGL